MSPAFVFEAILIAFVVGLLIGFVFGRDSR